MKKTINIDIKKLKRKVKKLKSKTTMKIVYDK